MALRPTLDDTSSSESCDRSSSDSSSSDEDSVERADPVSLLNSTLHCNEKNVAADSSNPHENSTDAGKTAVSPHQWFWSAFISVQRLPGVRFLINSVFKKFLVTRSHMYKLFTLYLEFSDIAS